MSAVAIIGAGTNGLAAACVAARAGLQVTVYEANDSIGGAARTGHLGGSDAVFDLGSAVHPMAMLSPALRDLKVHERVDFIVPDISYAHVNGRHATLAWHDLATTLDQLPGREAGKYAQLIEPLVQRIDELGQSLLHPLLRVPRHPRALASFASSTLSAAALLHGMPERHPRVSALLAGCAAHVAGGSRGPAATGAGVFLAAAAHGAGWPIPRGGSQAISNALAAELIEYGGRIQTSHRIDHLDELEQDVVLLDTSPETAALLGGTAIPDGLRRRLATPRRSPGSCVVHFVLREPVPWSNPDLGRAGTVHLGGGARQLVRSERTSRHRVDDRPFVLVAQPSRFDVDRVPGGRQVLWTYCHVPLGSPADMSRPIIAQLEAAAPGFGDLIEEYHVCTARDLQMQNAALVGGDITGGTMDLRGSIIRPRLSPAPWWLKTRGLYLISSAAPPGPSVHGMSGYLGARQMLAREFGIHSEA